MSNVRLLSVVNTFSQNDPSPDSVGAPISFERRCFFFCFFFFFVPSNLVRGSCRSLRSTFEISVQTESLPERMRMNLKV